MMRRRIRTIAGLGAFIAIQAMSIVTLSSYWSAAENTSDAKLFALLGAYFLMVFVALGVMALIWGGNAPPAGLPTPPPGPPPAMSPAGIPIGPRTPAPLVAHARHATVVNE
jgi:hypothetical protein